MADIDRNEVVATPKNKQAESGPKRLPDGKFMKGEGGRPKGTPNRTTKELREKIALIVGDKLEQFDAIFNAASPKTKLETITALIKYVVPALTKAEVDAAVKGDMKITVLFADYNKEQGE